MDILFLLLLQKVATRLIILLQAASSLAEVILDNLGWRWGYGLFAIIVCLFFHIQITCQLTPQDPGSEFSTSSHAFCISSQNGFAGSSR